MNKVKARFLATIGLGIASIGLCLVSLIDIARDYTESRKYNSRVNLLCQNAMRKFDEDESGFIDMGEGVAMSRAVGYEKVLPSDNLIFQLTPGIKRRKTARLHISNHESYSYDTSSSLFGILRFPSRGRKPVFYDAFDFPVSRLEDITE